MLKQCLLDAGVEGRLWKTQFGFRKNCSTENAIFVAFRKIETTCAQRYGKIHLLALDWKKAFDSIHLASLYDALYRFGVPSDVINMVQGIMLHRQIYGKDFGVRSGIKPQLFGISQGCTLSPLLLIMMMTVLMYDVVGDLADIIYVDDIFLFASSDSRMQEFIGKVADAGKQYGMEFHWNKS